MTDLVANSLNGRHVSDLVGPLNPLVIQGRQGGCGGTHPESAGCDLARGAFPGEGVLAARSGRSSTRAP